MSLKRLYEAKDINWVLIPDLLEKVTTQITNNYSVEIQNKLGCVDTKKLNYSII